ncbi:hypothetical protein [Flavonifractor plautii]|uniref:hypothetical protein n=1 Tax=Flavonifractor plautii TaxID=292800 RepID=UPI001FAB93A6|nr:hypothetical protein [Flavonifractor plautii]
MTIEICHHNFHCGVVDFFGAVPLMTFQRPAHAFAFFGAKAHDAVAVEIKLHLVHIANP